MGDAGEEAWKLTFRVDKSMRYHQRRRAFFDRCHRWVMFAVILSGSAAFADLVDPAYAAAAGALLAALDLTLGFGMRARDHQLLYQRFAELHRKLRGRPDLPGQEVAALRDECLAIEADEPPVMVALEVDCHNETARAWGTANPEMPVLSGWQRLTMHLLSHEKAQFALRKVTPRAA
jgi:hypothetical protein